MFYLSESLVLHKTPINGKQWLSRWSGCFGIPQVQIFRLCFILKKIYIQISIIFVTQEIYYMNFNWNACNLFLSANLKKNQLEYKANKDTCVYQINIGKWSYHIDNQRYLMRKLSFYSPKKRLKHKFSHKISYVLGNVMPFCRSRLGFRINILGFGNLNFKKFFEVYLKY